MAKAPTVPDFFNKFSTDEASCASDDASFRRPMYCPKCGAEGLFAKLKKLPAYACPTCGHHNPMAGTPFERSRTPLHKWFYAMYLHHVSAWRAAKELQRQLGVTYKTAWRMGHELRKYMAAVDGDPPLGGHVEAERPTWAGGAPAVSAAVVHGQDGSVWHGRARRRRDDPRSSERSPCDLGATHP